MKWFFFLWGIIILSPISCYSMQRQSSPIAPHKIPGLQDEEPQYVRYIIKYTEDIALHDEKEVLSSDASATEQSTRSWFGQSGSPKIPLITAGLKVSICLTILDVLFHYAKSGNNASFKQCLNNTITATLLRALWKRNCGELRMKMQNLLRSRVVVK